MAKTIYLGMGCFWGAEKKFWSLPGVVETSVGYQGGHTSEPTYKVVCAGGTDHVEIVKVVYDENVISTREILGVFWENHDPTQGNRQGGDVGTQYRSALLWTDDEQAAECEKTAKQFGQILTLNGIGPITTQIESAANHKYWLAEDYHQKYLIKNPNGYDCHAHTGYFLPKE
jgi:peptide-methionine (S)-S-oxide reductase